MDNVIIYLFCDVPRPRPSPTHINRTSEYKYINNSSHIRIHSKQINEQANFGKKTREEFASEILR